MRGLCDSLGTRNLYMGCESAQSRNLRPFSLSDADPFTIPDLFCTRTPGLVLVATIQALRPAVCHSSC